MRDIADRRKTELDLQRQAATDPLTGVANRTVFMDRLRHALRRLDRHDGLVAVLFLDLDRFKLINDSLGHHTGDAVLLQMAERLLQVLRPQDTLARLGGDEFAVVAEDLSSPEDAVALGERIIEAGRSPFQVHRRRPQRGRPLARGRPRALSRQGPGPGPCRRVRRGSPHQSRRGPGTERMLRRAIAEDRLRVGYQPIVDPLTVSETRDGDDHRRRHALDHRRRGHPP